MATAQQPTRRPGRPSKLTPEIANNLLALIVAGVPISEAAARVGVSRRSVQVWRARAYSQQPEDQPYVDLEQAITRGLIAAAEHERSAAVLAPLDDVLADLDRGWLSP